MAITLHTWSTSDKPALMALCNAVDRTFLSDRLTYPYTEADADWWLGMVAENEDRAWTKYKSFPPLYQRIRAYNVAFYKTRDKSMYEQTLSHLITETKAGRMFGEWNDYGRLLDY